MLSSNDHITWFTVKEQNRHVHYNRLKPYFPAFNKDMFGNSPVPTRNESVHISDMEQSSVIQTVIPLILTLDVRTHQTRRGSSVTSKQWNPGNKCSTLSELSLPDSGASCEIAQNIPFKGFLDEDLHHPSIVGDNGSSQSLKNYLLL